MEDMEILLEDGKELENFLDKDMRENGKTEKEIKEMREKDCIRVMVHGSDTEMFSIKKLEKKFQRESSTGTTRITVPSRDILEHQAGFPLHVTAKEEVDKVKKMIREIVDPRAELIKREEASIDDQLQALEKQEQTGEKTAKNICDMLEKLISFDKSNRASRKNIENALLGAVKK